jgi:predicted phage terminase large subunit-like protein
MASQGLIDSFNDYCAYIDRNGIDEQVIDALILASETALIGEKDKEYGLKISSKTKSTIEEYIYKLTGGTVWELEKYCFANKTGYEILDKYYKVLLLEAQNMVLDSYFQYLEKKREPKERFYMPKRKHFLRLGLIQALQDMLDDKLDILSISMPPGTQKTTLEKFFNSGVIGWFPKDFSLFFSHSGDIARMYYDGVLDIVSNADEYCWGEIFPDLSVTSTNAKMGQFNVGKYKPFPSLQTTSVGAENAGKVRASKFLLVDDMIGKLEEALNKLTLDKLWGVYSVDARQRKLDGCKELIIGTRWSVHDVIGRLQRLYEGNDRCRFIAYPDIDPETGQSNFDYEYMGFSVEFFQDQEKAMDDISYRCLYKNQPVEREGLLYTNEELRRYATLPDREPDAIVGLCDTKSKGIDYFVMPVFYKYDEDYYLVDCLCNKDSNYEVQYGKIVRMICEHNMQALEIEGNQGGDRIAHEIKERLSAEKQRCNITTKYTETNKETRIIVNAEWVKSHVLFKDKEDYNNKSEYGEFMNQLLSYSVEGKNKHDDVPDALAMFVLYVTRFFGKRQTVIINGLL